MKKVTTILKLDEYGQAINCYETAKYVAEEVHNLRPVALPLSLGNGTLFHISFVPLSLAVPPLAMYNDGSSRGIQINIDRKSSYALPVGSSINEWTYLSDKWDVLQGDAMALLPFFNTVMTGENYYDKEKNKR